MSELELKKLAVPVFKTTGASKLFATEDGQFFVKESRASSHARGAKKLKVYCLEAQKEEPKKTK